VLGFSRQKSSVWEGSKPEGTVKMGWKTSLRAGAYEIAREVTKKGQNEPEVLHEDQNRSIARRIRRERSSSERRGEPRQQFSGSGPN